MRWWRAELCRHGLDCAACLDLAVLSSLDVHHVLQVKELTEAQHITTLLPGSLALAKEGRRTEHSQLLLGLARKWLHANTGATFIREPEAGTKAGA